jgi:uncharacterized DUF497 family protein
MPKPPPGFDWDDKKARWNQKVHGLSFAVAAAFEFKTALELEGSDHETEEARTTLLGKIKRQTCVLVFTRRAGNIRVISLRRATREERKTYLEAKGY